ncbi:glycine cleavage system protein GcvH [Cohnella pontilimi]|uniref:Glycine cleavage system H protein n=1 Tax=Cohnella pontilimi TaxID=2564100 RepID=A0A4U0FHK1_9BACL|nr:glycine cleavage system protein GcvH [Cohnella pontilimi]TJY44431.1 glycine cleavage system protein GcvH [Cohnella pontilimi]
MSEVRDHLFYSEEHEWALPAGGQIVRVGITDHAQCQLGDIVFVELPEVGSTVVAGDSAGSIESVKTVSELYSPVSGKVVGVNDKLVDAPEIVNTSPYEDGWILEVEIDGSLDEALSKLLTPDQYRAIAD